jgi:phosphoribosylglycinamide formyltransferase-1
MRVAVMASGRGSNFQALIDAAEDGKTPDVELVHLIVNKKDAYVISRAKKHAIKYTLITSNDKTRREFDQQALKLLREQNIEIVVLAGFMRLLTPEFIDTYRNRILNIHPSLLPSFPGTQAHKDALKYGVKVSGCTAHLVDEGIDSGPIIMQTSVTLSNKETEESLANKILKHEHQILPKALQLLCSGKIDINGRHIKIKSD